MEGVVARLEEGLLPPVAPLRPVIGQAGKHEAPETAMDGGMASLVDLVNFHRNYVVLRDALGLDASTVRINQRLYAPNGKYTVPDIQFPGSGNSLDYSYELKKATTPQIMRIQQAAPSGTITIVPPAAVRPVYTIRP